MLRRSVRTITSAIALGVAGLALPAAAQQVYTPFYLGASVGATYAAVDAEANANAAFTSTDRSDAGIKGYLGLRLHRHFAIEAGYADLGEIRARTGNFSGFVEREWRTKSPFVDAVAIFPIAGRWSAFGKVGAAWTDVKVHTKSGGSVTPIPLASDHKREVNFKFGFGGMFDITPNLSARAEVEVYTGIGDGSVGLDNGSIGMYTIGIQYRF